MDGWIVWLFFFWIINTVQAPNKHRPHLAFCSLCTVQAPNKHRTNTAPTWYFVLYAPHKHRTSISNYFVFFFQKILFNSHVRCLYGAFLGFRTVLIVCCESCLKKLVTWTPYKPLTSVAAILTSGKRHTKGTCLPASKRGSIPMVYEACEIVIENS